MLKTYVLSFLTALAVFLLQGCLLSSSGTWVNDSIRQSKRDEISVLNKRLFSDIQNNDVAAVKSMMSEMVVQKVGKGIDTLVNKLSPFFKETDYTVLDEYNVRNSTDNVANSIRSSNHGDNDYILQYLALNKEMYVSLLKAGDKTNQLLITVIYGNYNGKWQINILEAGQFKYYGKSAVDYYKMAKRDYEKSYYINAGIEMYLAKACLRPGNDFFNYKKETEIVTLYDSLSGKERAMYKLPIVLENIPGKPGIIDVIPQMMSNGCFPLVAYHTKINLKDTLAIERENVEVKKDVNRIFNGIGENKKYILYQAFNELPDGQHLVKRYTMVDSSLNTAGVQ